MIFYDNKKKKLYIKEKDSLDFREITLRPKEHGIWELLSRHNNQVTSRQSMCEEVWGGRYVTDFTINQTINQLRKKIGIMGKEVIITIPRKGYAINPYLIVICTEDEKENLLHPVIEPVDDVGSCSKNEPEEKENLDECNHQQSEVAIAGEDNSSARKQKKKGLVNAFKRIYKSLF